MRITLRDLARLVDGEVVGDDSTVITGFSGIKEAYEGDITFLANPKYLPFIDKTRASAVITSKEIKRTAKPIIRTDNPSLAFARIISFVVPEEIIRPEGIHPSVVLGKNVSLGKNTALGAYTVIEDEVSIADDTVIYSGCFVGHHTKIGSNTLVYPNVSIRERVCIGNRVIIHSGTVIGSDGFGYVEVNGRHQKVPQIGTVEIGDDVEIGANVTIDRARFDKTVIGQGTKIDNLVQIAHNVIIGENSIIVAQVGISGSTAVGKNVTLAGQAGVAGHLNIGNGAIVAARAGVTKSVPANTVVSGFPAKPHDMAKRVNACVQNLPKLYEEVKRLKKKIEELEAKPEKKSKKK